MIQLSNIAPDFNDLVTQLQTALSTKSAWKDRITSSTGQTLVEMAAAIGAYSQYSIESAYQESFPETAKNKRSLYSAANFLGVRINRKSPASVQVSLTAPAPTTVPVNSVFNGSGTYWFNRTALSLSTTPTTVTLYQGKVNEIQLNGLGTNFQAFVTNETDFVVSDTDVYVSLNSVSIPAIQQGLWTKAGLPGAQHFTYPDGRMVLLFGNDLYGSKPMVNDVIRVTYVVTLGEDGNNVPTINKVFSMDTNPSVAGRGTTQASGGGSQANPLVYKNVPPALFGAFDSSVTASQYKRLPLQYPGVLDAKTFAQREVNPKALSWMNVIKVCLLTSSPWSPTDWTNFEQWFSERTMYSTRLFREDPVASNVTVTATVYCTNLANLGAVDLKVKAAVNALFAKRQGIIGLDIYKSDVINAILQADSNVEYVDLDSPTNDVILSSLNVDAPTITTAAGSGTLAIGQYSYGISVISALGGETAPANWTTINVTAGLSINTLNWNSVENATGYKVWGRSAGSYGLLATLGLVTTYNDTGAASPTGTVPVQGTVSVFYPNLVTVNTTMKYSTRDRLE